MILNQTQNKKTDAYILLQEVLRGWPSLWSFDPKQNRILSLWETHFTILKLTKRKPHNIQENQDIQENLSPSCCWVRQRGRLGKVHKAFEF